MKVFILVDENKIVRCITSEECNLHKDKLHMKKFHVEMRGTVGDEYNAESDNWILRPGNYPQPSEEEIYEKKVAAKIREIAIRELGEEPKKKIRRRRWKK